MTILEEFEDKEELNPKYAKLVQREINECLKDGDSDWFEMIKDQLNDHELNHVEFDEVESITVSYNKYTQQVDLKIEYKENEQTDRTS